MSRCLHAIRHLAFEDLGSLEGLARARGFVPQYTEAVDVPASGFAWETADPVVLLGGPIGVHDAEDYPCIGAVIEGLRGRLARGLPTLGICLGAQLIAAALGAQVRVTGAQHVGWWPLDSVSAHSPLAPLREVPVLHWHGDTFELPHGAQRLAGTATIPNQAFSLHAHAILALQFHIEITSRAMEQWLIGNRTQLGQLGISPSTLRAATAEYAAGTERAAHQVVGSWLDMIR